MTGRRSSVTTSRNDQKMSWLKRFHHHPRKNRVPQWVSLAEKEKENLDLSKHVYVDFAVNFAM